jgi:UDP-glucose:(heptosyl)LPS alpha-1,3-glucosyltransferase
MRIALLIERFDPTGGGQERSVHQIARELIQRGHHITIVTGDSPPEFKLEGGHIHAGHTLDFRHRVKVSAFARWAPRALAEGNYDTSLSVTMACPAVVMQPRGGTIRETLDRNVAARAAGGSRVLKRLSQMLNPKRQSQLRLERATLSHPMVRRFVAISRYVREQLRRHYGVDDGRIVIIPNAAEMPAVGDEQRRLFRERVRKGFNVADDSVAFLFAAYNPRLKGVEPLLHATKKLVQQGRNLTILMAGQITYGQQLLAASLGIRGNVRMIGPTNQMAELFCAADVTVLPTFYDPSSKVVIESLMMGVPAISTAFNGASDFIVTDGGRSRGRVVSDPGDVNGLAAAMDELLDAGERNRCSAATAGMAESLSMRRHVDLLEQVLTESAGQDG